MQKFNITYPDTKILSAIFAKIDNLTKPKGAFGRLEELAARVGMIQQTVSPSFSNPCNVLFAADHGIIKEGVSISPKEVTWQQMIHFATGNAGINFLCKQNGFKLVLVDAGVDYDFPEELGIINMKVDRGTKNFLKGPAMTPEQMNLCIERGAKIVEQIHKDGCNVVSFGEMGCGNTSASSMWMHYFTGVPLPQCVGAGAGLDSRGISYKFNVLSHAYGNHKYYNQPRDTESLMAYFGGFEMVMAVGGMLKAAELGMVILVDGFIMTACMAAAMKLYPPVVEYAIFGHCGDESGHRIMLRAMGADPLLDLSLRLGEGTGAVCAYPVVLAAVNMINQMDSFEDAEVTKYFE